MINHLASFTSHGIFRKTVAELTPTQLSDLVEGHLGSLMGLVSRIYDSKACPTLIAESDQNLLGGFYLNRGNGEFAFNDDIKLVEKLFKKFDPLKLVCSTQMAQIQFMTKFISQMLLLMELAGFRVI